MAITDQQFEDWLRADGEERTVIVKMTHQAGDEFFSNTGFMDGAQEYPDRVLGNANYSASLNQQRFVGLGSASWANIKLKNLYGDLDYLTDLNFAGREISVKVGRKDWDESDFRVMVTAIIQEVVAPSASIVEVRLLSIQAFLSNNINENFFQPGDLLPGSPHPIAWGPVLNMEPVLVENGIANYPGGKWFVNSGLQTGGGDPHGVLNVFDDSQPLTNRAEGLGFPIPAGNWQVFTEALGAPNSGTATGFYLGSAPAGVLTCDYSGNITNSPPVQSAREAINKSLSVAVPGPFSPSVVTPAGGDTPELVPVNFFSRELVRAQEIISRMVESVGGTGTFDKNGDFIFAVINDSKLTVGSPSITLTEDDIVENGFTLIRHVPPSSSVKMNFFKNWTIQDQPGTAPVGFEDRTARINQEYILRTDIITTSNLLARESFKIDSLVHGHDQADDNTDSANWGTDLNIILGSEILGRETDSHTIYQLRTKAIGFVISPGDLIEVFHTRFGFESGRKAIVLAVNIGMGQSSNCVLTLYTKSNQDGGFVSKTIFGFEQGTDPFSGSTAPGSTGSEGVAGDVQNQPPPVNPNPPQPAPHAPFIPSFLGGIDSNTLTFLEMGELSSSGAEGEDPINWTLGSIDVTGTEEITLDSDTIEMPFREFDGNTHLLADTPIIDSDFGSWTIELVFKAEDFAGWDYGNTQICGNLTPFGGGKNNGIFCVARSLSVLRTQSGEADTLQQSVTPQIPTWDSMNPTGNEPWEYFDTPIHFVITYNSKDKTRRIAWKKGGRVTGMDKQGLGNDMLAIKPGATEDFETTPNGFLLGFANHGALPMSNNGFNGRIYEFKISRVSRYQTEFWENENFTSFPATPDELWPMSGGGSYTGLTLNGSVDSSTNKTVFGVTLPTRKFSGGYFQQTSDVVQGNDDPWTMEIIFKPGNSGQNEYLYSSFDLTNSVDRYGYQIRLEKSNQLRLNFGNGGTVQETLTSLDKTKYYHLILRKFGSCAVVTNGTNEEARTEYELVCVPFFVKDNNSYHKLKGQVRKRIFVPFDGADPDHFTGAMQEKARLGAGWDSSNGYVNFTGEVAYFAIYKSDRFIKSEFAVSHAFKSINYDTGGGFSTYIHDAHTPNNSIQYELFRVDSNGLNGSIQSYWDEGAEEYYFIKENDSDLIIIPDTAPPGEWKQYKHQGISPFDRIWRDFGFIGGDYS